MISNTAKIKALLESKQWILRANSVGQSDFVDHMVNYVGIYGENAIVQFGTSDESGHNGIGGCTFEGKIDKYELKEGKKLGSGFTLIIMVNANGVGATTIQLNISPNGNAFATVSELGVVYRGQLFASDENTAYKGPAH